MSNDRIIVLKQNLLRAYRQGNELQRAMLQTLFADNHIDFDEQTDVRERVKTFVDALNELGENHPLVKQYDMIYNEFGTTMDADIIAYLKLRIIAAALNEGWEPQFTEDEYRYYPYFYLYTKEEYEKLSDEDKKRCVGRSNSSAGAGGGLVCAGSAGGSAGSGASASGGVRLAFRTKELAQYAGKQFLDIWADFVFKIGDTDKTEEE